MFTFRNVIDRANKKIVVNDHFHQLPLKLANEVNSQIIFHSF